MISTCFKNGSGACTYVERLAYKSDSPMALDNDACSRASVPTLVPIGMRKSWLQGPLRR